MMEPVSGIEGCWFFIWVGEEKDFFGKSKQKFTRVQLLSTKYKYRSERLGFLSHPRENHSLSAYLPFTFEKLLFTFYEITKFIDHKITVTIHKLKISFRVYGLPFTSLRIPFTLCLITIHF